MTLRTRILLAASLLVLLPTLVLSLAGRQQTAHRLREQHAARLDAMATLLEEDLALRADAIAARLAALGRDLQGDLALRRALTGDDPASQRLRIDLAARRMALMGLDVLQIQDAEGRILSAGHFRDAFDRREPGLADALARQPGGTALAEFRRPEGSLLALTRLDSLRLDGRDYRLLGGERLDDAALRRLAGGSGLRLALLVDGEPRATSGGPLPGEADRSLPLAALGPRGEPREGVLLLAESRGALAALLGGFDLWLLGALTATLAGGLALALWLSTRLGRPLRDLAARTERLDLDNLDADFPLAGERRDEVGALARTLSLLTSRLRSGRVALVEAERRATLGDLARQVTHDIRNGFTPLRNVLAHLSRLARETPAELPAVYLEREGTLTRGLAYLEDLADHYARLRPERRAERVDLGALLREIVPVGEAGGVRTRLAVAPDLPRLVADPASLRRIAENLLRNAREALGPEGGRVDVDLRQVERDGEPHLRLEVADDGCGIAPEDRSRVFEDFYTSKAQGSGLGLSVVRRLAADLGGRVELDSAPGAGARFRVLLPLSDPSPGSER
ncbi:MAG: ATP-binding protein [Candidatus Krumholzibacteriia bacterium]|nr:HAMP domain-containing protein [Candidatus Latescibacterota bacterium]MCB9516280.1 HAMP domain-containing protein [Candidatus Latescibacterota bacterium]